MTYPLARNSSARRDEVRRLGFDPNHLTHGEQTELLELDERLRKTSRRPPLAPTYDNSSEPSMIEPTMPYSLASVAESQKFRRVSSSIRESG